MRENEATLVVFEPASSDCRVRTQTIYHQANILDQLKVPY